MREYLIAVVLKYFIVVSIDFLCLNGFQVLKFLNVRFIIFEVLVNIEALVIVESPMSWILYDGELPP